MEKFNQSKFESKAKKLVANRMIDSYYDGDEEDICIIWFNKVGEKAKAVLKSNLGDSYYYEVNYSGKEGKYILYIYDIVDYEVHDEDSLEGV